MIARPDEEVPQLIPIPVTAHIASVGPGLSLGSYGKRECGYHVIPRTVVLTSDEPVKQLLAPNPNREYAIIIARTNDVVLCESKGDGQAASNVSDTTYANPNGSVIPHDIEITFRKITSEMWAAAATYPTRVTVLACVRRD